MPTISSYTAERISEIEAATIVGGYVDGNGDLILVRFDDVEINAGPVIGPEGPTGPGGGIPEAPIDGTGYVRKDAAWASQSPGLLSVVRYNPDPFVSVTNPGSSFVDVDAVNLAISFVVPSSGKVLIKLSAIGYIHLAAASAYHWGLREGLINIDTTELVAMPTGGTSERNRKQAEFLITGLTPGASKTYKWSHAAVINNNGVISYGVGPGPAIMEAWSAP